MMKTWMKMSRQQGLSALSQAVQVLTEKSGANTDILKINFIAKFYVYFKLARRT